jgi:hypothetical protein
MKRTPLLAGALLCIATIALYAANPHFLDGPSASDMGTTLKVCGSIAGLGNEDVTIVVTAKGEAYGTCTNKGQNEPPGQNPLERTIEGKITNLEPKNGRVDFCVTTAEPGAATAKELGCPNNNWTATIIDVKFTAMTVTVWQKGKVVYQASYPSGGSGFNIN